MALLRDWLDHKFPRNANIAATNGATHLVVGKANQEVIVRALKRRQYHAIQLLFDKGVEFLDKPRGRSNIELFVEHGYAVLLKGIGHAESKRKFQDGKWHAFQDALQLGLYTDLSPSDAEDSQSIMLPTALERALPNMDVVHRLIEEFYVDVNQRRYKNTYLDSGYEMLPQETALHYLAKGLH